MTSLISRELMMVFFVKKKYSVLKYKSLKKGIIITDIYYINILKKH